MHHRPMTETHFLSERARDGLPHFLADLADRFDTYARLHGEEVGPREASSLLSRVPALSEDAYRELSLEILTQQSRARFLVDLTSGTNGVAKTRISTHRDEAAEARLCTRYFEHLGLGPGHRVAALDIDSADIYTFYGTVLLGIGADAFEFETVDQHYRLGEWLGLEPTTIISLPSLLSRLLPEIRRARRAGQLGSLKTIVCIGEPLESSLREAVRDGVGADCYSFYGCTETGSLAGECLHHRGLHVLDDLAVLTLRSARGKESRTGDLLWTTMHFYDHPVVKYASGDVATMWTGPCSCGLPGPVLSNIRRASDSFSLFGCQFEYAGIGEAVGAAVGEQMRFQVEIEDDARPVVRLLLPTRLKRHRRTLAEAFLGVGEFRYLADQGLLDWALAFDDARLTGSRKARRVVDRRTTRG